MVELYFLLVWLPRRISPLAKARKRSAVGWSLLAIAAWLGSESLVFFGFVFVQAVGAERWGWSGRPHTLLAVFVYVLALAAAVAGAEFVKRVLTSLPTNEPPPPLPPRF